MAKRNWIMKWSYGYVGTDNEEPIDLVDYLGMTEEAVEELTDEEAGSLVAKEAWEMAVEQVEAFGEPAE